MHFQWRNIRFSAKAVEFGLRVCRLQDIPPFYLGIVLVSYCSQGLSKASVTEFVPLFMTQGLAHAPSRAFCPPTGAVGPRFSASFFQDGHTAGGPDLNILDCALSFFLVFQ